MWLIIYWVWWTACLSWIFTRIFHEIKIKRPAHVNGQTASKSHEFFSLSTSSTFWIMYVYSKNDRSEGFRIDICRQLWPHSKARSPINLSISFFWVRIPGAGDFRSCFNVTPVPPFNHFIESAGTFPHGIAFRRPLSVRPRFRRSDRRALQISHFHAVFDHFSAIRSIGGSSSGDLPDVAFFCHRRKQSPKLGKGDGRLPASPASHTDGNRLSQALILLGQRLWVTSRAAISLSWEGSCVFPWRILSSHRRVGHSMTHSSALSPRW